MQAKIEAITSPVCHSKQADMEVYSRVDSGRGRDANLGSIVSPKEIRYELTTDAPRHSVSASVTPDCSHASEETGYGACLWGRCKPRVQRVTLGDPCWTPMQPTLEINYPAPCQPPARLP
ncbi:hypothetical protein LSAT2_001738, partial [Lamellibrachia satsuma]